jgi:hypothetical protein
LIPSIWRHIPAALFLLTLSSLALAAEQGPATLSSPRELRFDFRPKAGPAAAYDFPEQQDQPLMVIYPGVTRGKPAPVVVGFHGQPVKNRLPRDYAFFKSVRQTVDDLVLRGIIEPLVLVLPTFRFRKENWPGMHPKELRRKIESLMAEQGLVASQYLAFGHSGAAGCGGKGLNEAHELSPTAVGFFDTCLGDGFAKELATLEARGISTLIVHSVETAGLRPKRRPEYQAQFDFGSVFGPLGLLPIECPGKHPGKALRPLAHKCAASHTGTVRAFVVDTGQGEEAHEAALPEGLTFFLETTLPRRQP